MDKRRPSYDIEAVKRAVGSLETLSITTTAFRDAQSLGFDRSSVVKAVVGIPRSMFFKSMTTFGDHQIWQDVYHVPFDDLVLYVKIQADIITEFRIMSFKER